MNRLPKTLNARRKKTRPSKYSNNLSLRAQLDFDNINVTNIHRLPQHSKVKKKNGSKVQRPVIIKAITHTFANLERYYVSILFLISDSNLTRVN